MPSLFTFIAALALSAGLCTAVASPELQDIRRMHHQRMRLHRRAGPSATPQPESVIADTSFNGCPYITYQGTPYAANQLFLVYQPDRTATATGVNKLTCVRPQPSARSADASDLPRHRPHVPVYAALPRRDGSAHNPVFCVYDRFGVQTASSDARWCDCPVRHALTRAAALRRPYSAPRRTRAATACGAPVVPGTDVLQVCPGVSGHPRSDINDVSSSLGDTSQFLRCSYLQSATGTDDDICLWSALWLRSNLTLTIADANTVRIAAPGSRTDAMQGEAQDSNGPICPSSASLRQARRCDCDVR